MGYAAMADPLFPTEIYRSIHPVIPIPLVSIISSHFTLCPPENNNPKSYHPSSPLTLTSTGISLGTIANDVTVIGAHIQTLYPTSNPCATVGLDFGWQMRERERYAVRNPFHHASRFRSEDGN